MPDDVIVAKAAIIELDIVIVRLVIEKNLDDLLEFSAIALRL